MTGLININYKIVFYISFIKATKMIFHYIQYDAIFIVCLLFAKFRLLKSNLSLALYHPRLYKEFNGIIWSAIYCKDFITFCEYLNYAPLFIQFSLNLQLCLVY